MHHIFIRQNEIIDNHITIYKNDNNDNYNHLKSSLRLKIGENVRVSVIDSDEDCDYMTKTIDIDTDSIILDILEKIDTNELGVKINLYQAMPKKDIFEDIVDKAVELGIYSITPMISTNCISKITDDKLEKKLTRFNKISKSAAEQSMRAIIPTINKVLDYREVIDKIKNDKYNLLFYEDAKVFLKTVELFEKIKNDNDKKIVVNIIIGPEGGFTKDEIEYAIHNNIHILSLGSRILRVETATLTALSYVNYIMEGK